MDFDIAGSAITITNVVVTGQEKTHDNDTWGVKLTMDTARARWRKPVTLDVKASIDMTDSRPFVAMMANQRGKEGWLGRALTVDDVSGQATLKMKDENMVIPLAYASSEKIVVGAKGLINADKREGAIYVRYKKIDGLLRIDNGSKNLDILRARGTFDAYEPGKIGLKAARAKSKERKKEQK
jgi:hypothetical protein